MSAVTASESLVDVIAFDLAVARHHAVRSVEAARPGVAWRALS